MQLNSNLLYILLAIVILVAGAWLITGVTDYSVDSGYDPESLALQKIWETPADFRVPESVLYNADQELLYVASIDGPINAQDGNGFVSTLSLDGEIQELDWATGLNGPKGMSLYDGVLYVADITEIVALDALSGEVLSRHPAEDSILLNDLTVTETGVIYASDTFAQRIYKLEDGETSLFAEEPEFDSINGIAYDRAGARLLSGSFNLGTLFEVNLEDGAVTQHIDQLGSFDGIEADGYGNYWVSDFGGRIFLTDLTERYLIDDSLGVNAADIEYVPESNMLYVPTFRGNQVIAFEVVEIE